MATVTKGSLKLEEILGAEATDLLTHKSATVPASQLHLPGPDFVDRVWKDSDRPTRVLRSLQSMFGHGRLGNTGYLSILPVDQGIEHTAGASFAPNPIYFDGEKIVELAIEGNCNAVASTFGVLGSVARRYAHRIPFICKLNHNELLTFPTKYDQVLFGTVREALEMGAVAVGATIYFGSPESDRQLQEIAVAFHAAHELGMATVLWCYLRNSNFKKDGVNYETATDHPIDLCRYQVINCFMGRASLINSGGESKGAADLKDALRTAVINKRAGGTGLIAGRKSFQRPMKEGIELLHAIQDVYLDPTVTIA